MLGKLIKHEWKSTYKVGGLMALFTVIVTFLGWLSFKSPMWQTINNDYYSFNPLDILSFATLLIYVFMLVGITYGTMIYMGVHFYKTMYTDQGYLTHTLPVGKHQLLGSKILISGLWMIIIELLVILSSFIVICSLLTAVMPEGYSLADLWNEFRPVYREILWKLEQETGLKLTGYIAYALIAALIGPFVTMTILFGAITVGQLFTKVRVLMAIVCYVGIIMINGLISSLVQSIVSFKTSSIDAYVNIQISSSSIVSLIVAVILYVISYQIVTKKLNME